MNTELKNELLNRKSILGSIDKQYIINEHEVPNGYFDQMEDKFFASLKKEVDIPRETKTISFWERTRVSYSIAAVSIFAIVGFGLFSLLRKDSINSLSQNEVVSYLEDEDELSTEIPSSSNININELTNEEIKKYLMENEGIDLNNMN